jgi:hypothetical protein
LSSSVFLRLLSAALFFSSGVRDAVATEPPSGTFALGTVTLGHTTLTDVKNEFGAAPETRLGKEDESDIRICYRHDSGVSRATYVAFDSVPMGGFASITGFQLSANRPRGTCVHTEIDVETLQTTNGIHLGQTLEEFRRIVRAPLRQKGDVFSYDGQSRREMTAAEKARAQPSPATDAYFDITMQLSADFHHGQLTRLHIVRFESN